MDRRAFIVGIGAGAVAAACSTAKKRSAAAPAATTVPPPTTTTGAPAPRGPATYVAHGPAGSTGVALTFHTAGDPTITRRILADAARLDAKLTFFVVGTWASANTDTVRAIVEGGHELGNHTWSHIDIKALPTAEMRAEIERCAAVLQQETGTISRWFRPSQTDVPTRQLLVEAGDVGYTTSVGYDIDPLDYTDPGAAAVERRVAAALHGGAIVSLHTLYEGTAVAFPAVVDHIRAAGLQPVTTSAVLDG
jgi:peptidoglycan/xylan/chitin deacetylase (PgdA/CDA1 family)